MTPVVSMPVAALPHADPSPIPAQSRRPDLTRQLALPWPGQRYCQLVDDNKEVSGGDEATDTGTWAQYVAWAAARAGSVKDLADRAQLARPTVSAWKNGKSPERVTVRSIRAIAAAVGDNPDNAMRAAGRIPPDSGPAPLPAVPPLAAQLEAINRRIEAIRALGLSPDDEWKAIRTQQDFADQIVESWRRARPDGDAEGRQSA